MSFSCLLGSSCLLPEAQTEGLVQVEYILYDSTTSPIYQPSLEVANY